MAKRINIIIESTDSKFAFERAEAKRYEKLRKAPKDTGICYPELNLEGTSIFEILDHKV